MKEKPLTYRSYRIGDEKQIQVLYEEVFGKSRTPEQWRWEFMEPPEGPSNIRLIEQGGRIVGHVAQIPLRLHCLDRELVIGKSEDSSLSPDYRGQRLFKPLEQECFDTSAEMGYSLAYSISRTAREVHLKAGYRALQPLPGYFLPLNPERVSHKISRLLPANVISRPLSRGFLALLEQRFKKRWGRRSRSEGDISIQETARFAGSADELWNEFSAQNRVITIKRSSEYLNWRFAQNPNRKYHKVLALSDGKPVAYMISAAINRREDFDCDLQIGVVSDFLFLKGYERALWPLFDRALKFWKSMECDCLINWVQKTSPLFRPFREQLRQLGFISMMGRFSIPISIRVLRNDVSCEEVLNERDWFITLAMCGRWA